MERVSVLENAQETQAPPQVDRCIASYVTRCRKRIPGFVETHFSLQETWKLQRPTLWMDLALAPVNSAWALPYVALQKIAEGMDKLGWPTGARWVKGLPSGFKTGYQVEVERLLCT